MDRSVEPIHKSQNISDWRVQMNQSFSTLSAESCLKTWGRFRVTLYLGASPACRKRGISAPAPSIHYLIWCCWSLVQWQVSCHGKLQRCCQTRETGLQCTTSLMVTVSSGRGSKEIYIGKLLQELKRENPLQNACISIFHIFFSFHMTLKYNWEV